MSIELIEGFDLVGSNDDLLNKNWGVTEGSLGPTIGRFGGSGYTLSDELILGTTYIRGLFSSISFYRKAPLVAAPIAGFDARSTPDAIDAYCQASIRLNTDGSISLYGALNSLQGVSAAGVIQENEWHHIEFKAHLSTNGTCFVIVDGITVLEVTGYFLWDASGDYASLVIQGCTGGATYDDVVLQRSLSAHPPVIGHHRIHTTLPSADTAQADWTGTYNDINDPFGSSDGNATTITTSTVANKSEFELNDLVDSLSQVIAVQTVIEARKEGDGARALTPYLLSNSIIGEGVEFATATSYQSHTSIFETNPEGGVAWTEDSVNAVKIGIEVTI